MRKKKIIMMELNVSWPLKPIKLLGYPLAIVDEWNSFFIYYRLGVLFLSSLATYFVYMGNAKNNKLTEHKGTCCTTYVSANPAGCT